MIVAILFFDYPEIGGLGFSSITRSEEKSRQAHYNFKPECFQLVFLFCFVLFFVFYLHSFARYLFLSPTRAHAKFTLKSDIFDCSCFPERPRGFQFSLLTG